MDSCKLTDKPRRKRTLKAQDSKAQDSKAQNAYAFAQANGHAKAQANP